MSLLAAMTFVAVQSCQKTPESVTEINLESETLQVAPEGGSATMGYTITNPIEGVTAEATSTTEWLHDFDCSTEGQITFIVDENPEVGQSRTAIVTVTYGTIEKDFTVLQAEGVEKAPFDIDITEIGLDYAVATITPLDQEMTWHALTYEKWYLDENFETLNDAIEKFLQDYRQIASLAGMDFETFMATQVLVTGTKTMTFDQLVVGEEQYILAVGLDAQGNILTDGVLEPFTTESIEMTDVTFDFSIDIDGPDVTLKTTPSDNSVRYYTDVKLKSDWPNGPDIQGWLQTLIWRDTVFGTPLDQVIGEISSFGEVEKEYYLNANTDYYAFAVAITEAGIVCSESAVEEFTTGEIPMSDNTFDIEINEIGSYYVNFNIMPSNDDKYTFAVSPVSEWEGMSDEEYVEQYAMNNSLILTMISRTGGWESLIQENLAADTDYYIFVFGYEQYKVTTLPAKLQFRTAPSSNPEELTFQFETKNITPNSVDVKIVGTPEQALYYWDVIDADATQEETKALLDERVQEWIDTGNKENRSDYFLDMGARGTVEKTVYTYNLHYNRFDSIQPGKEYKLYAVGIYSETGEYATDFYFSEPFTTPEQ